MKKTRLVSICIIVFFIMLSAINETYAVSYGRLISFDNNKVMTYQQLDYMRIISAKGHSLAELETNTYIDTVKSVEEIGKDIDICFVLDVSGSMNDPTNQEEYEIYSAKLQEAIDELNKDIEEGRIVLKDEDGKEIVITPGEKTYKDSKDYKTKLNKITKNIAKEYPVTKKIEALKSGVCDLIKKIKETYEGKQIARVAAVKYSGEDNIGTIFGLTECSDENIPYIEEKINELKQGGKTYTVQAIQYTNGNVWKENKSNSLKYTILITDGAASNNRKSIGTEIRNIRKKTDKFITVFVASVKNPQTYEKTYKDYEESDQTFFIDSKDFYNVVTKDLFEYVITDYVDATTLITDVVQSYNANIGDTNNFFAEIDDELLNGAIMQMEYSFNVVTTEKIEEIKVTDYLQDLGFDPNTKFITCNETNSTYGWVEGNTGILQTTINPKNEIDEDGKYKQIVIKVLLTKVISVESNITEQDNKADIEIKTASGKVYKTSEAVDSGRILTDITERATRRTGNCNQTCWENFTSNYYSYTTNGKKQPCIY